jgi:hypothetical protein
MPTTRSPRLLSRLLPIRQQHPRRAPRPPQRVRVPAARRRVQQLPARTPGRPPTRRRDQPRERRTPQPRRRAQPEARVQPQAELGVQAQPQPELGVQAQPQAHPGARPAAPPELPPEDPGPSRRVTPWLTPPGEILSRSVQMEGRRTCIWPVVEWTCTMG